MDKKAAKQQQVLRSKLQQLQRQHAGAKQQADDPAERQRLEKEVAETQAALERIKNG
jgi:hypothetical protein